MAKRTHPTRYDQLHPQQKLIFDFIKAIMQQHSYGPTLREIMAELAITSTSVVHYHVRRLVEAGFLEKAHGISRGLRIPDHLLQTPSPATIPVLKEVVTNFSESVPSNGRVAPVRM